MAGAARTRSPSQPAREAGLALTAHAGEVAGPQRVREVLDFGVRRVAHGVTADDDPDAARQLLRARDITLDLCPTSNVQAGIVADRSRTIRSPRSIAPGSASRSRPTTGPSPARPLTEELARTRRRARPGATTSWPTIALNAFRRAFAPPALAGAAHARTPTRAWDAWRSDAAIS